jgi:D-alanyl-lipoteichoic acid acyltransferase DltB (MBOAT superfamily)
MMMLDKFFLFPMGILVFRSLAPQLSLHVASLYFSLINFVEAPPPKIKKIINPNRPQLRFWTRVHITFCVDSIN